MNIWVQPADRLKLVDYVCRVGHHSTSDDSTAYRSIEEIQKWTKDENPMQKFRLYLEQKGTYLNRY